MLAGPASNIASWDTSGIWESSDWDTDRAASSRAGTTREEESG